ncbi:MULTISPECIES: ATP-binding protein [Actinosynnema]|uniref:histidine kinase n=1 Tax=Actinosynnema pretiosum TaxID=42197 RepID=A0A290Z4J2_9PSEU|nr:ATP-binding protein [Actinosynnema pretiosum]ATE53937.1 hybrid sensor histidine kinase/response regulator [Actinosynnema pretiosum]
MIQNAVVQTDLASLRTCVDLSPDPAAVVRLTGDVVLVNPRMLAVFGYAEDQVIGRSATDFAPEATRELLRWQRGDFVSLLLAGQMPETIRLHARRSNGATFQVEVSACVVVADGELMALLTVRDIEQRLSELEDQERKRAAIDDRALARRNQAERLESLGQLAGGVAHDFNNLLGVMLNYTTFVEEELAEAAEGDGEHWTPVLEDLIQVRRAVERAAQLTRQLLVFGRREVVRARPFNVNCVVAGVEPMLRRTIGEHIALDIELDHEVKRAFADPGQIENVLLNLVINARDAMPGGGSLTVDTGMIELDPVTVAQRPQLKPGEYVRLRVSDTGEGITDDVLERIFEPFFTTKPKGEGTGLGLATVYGIVQQAGGDVQLYSQPGLGTTASVLLPVTEAESPEEDDGPELLRDGGEGGTILLVEDQVALREVTRRLLERNGYDVITAPNGMAALRTAHDHDGHIDLVLTDVVMPGMLGKELGERVTLVRPGVAVVYMSGYAQPVLTSQGTLNPGVVLVEKPFSEAELMSKVHAAVEGHRAQVLAGDPR